MNTLTPLRHIAALALVAAAPAALAQSELYVDADATGANTGTSWANAYTSLTAALQQTEISGPGDVWVASGRYVPGTSRTATFTIVQGVRVIGGFRGTEASVAERPANFLSVAPTILDGDYDNGSPTAIGDVTATYDVVTFTGVGTLDGVIVEGGNDPRALSVVGPAGFSGGILVNGPDASGSTIRNAVVRNNDATQTGSIGGFVAGYTLVNVLVTNTGSGPTPNDVVAAVGARSDLVSDPAANFPIFFDNVTIAGNGGQVYSETEGNATFLLTAENSIFYGNLQSLPAGSLQLQGSDAILTNVIFDGQDQCGAAIATCTNVVATNPQLSTDGFFSLQAGSVALDYGNTALVPAGVTTDGAGRPRVQGAAVDAGAFEGTAPVAVAGEGGPAERIPAVTLSVAPNPSGGRATVHLYLASTERVTVTVYDVLGRLVATLHDGPVAARTAFTASFDGTRLAPGSYAVRAASDSGVAMQRVVILR